MKPEIIKRLNQINIDFYNQVGTYFDSSRQYSWTGWEDLWSIPEIKNKKFQRILDIGCGNGRFLDFIQKKDLINNTKYTGIDANKYLLQKAEGRFKQENFSFFLFDLINDIDLLENLLEQNKFDLIVVFGVMHHVPSFAKRVKLLQKLKALLTDDGFLILSNWNFGKDQKLMSKAVPWAVMDIDKVSLEKNDFLLTWDRGKKAYRYAHFIDGKEEKRLFRDSNLKVIKNLYADGKSNELNKYFILQRM